MRRQRLIQVPMAKSNWDRAMALQDYKTNKGPFPQNGVTTEARPGQTALGPVPTPTRRLIFALDP